MPSTQAPFSRQPFSSLIGAADLRENRDLSDCRLKMRMAPRQWAKKTISQPPEPLSELRRIRLALPETYETGLGRS
jgi:hypothetical protein